MNARVLPLRTARPLATHESIALVGEQLMALDDSAASVARCEDLAKRLLSLANTGDRGWVRVAAVFRDLWRLVGEGRVSSGFIESELRQIRAIGAALMEV